MFSLTNVQAEIFSSNGAWISEQPQVSIACFLFTRDDRWRPPTWGHLTWKLRLGQNLIILQRRQWTSEVSTFLQPRALWSLPYIRGRFFTWNIINVNMPLTLAYFLTCSACSKSTMWSSTPLALAAEKTTIVISLCGSGCDNYGNE